MIEEITADNCTAYEIVDFLGTDMDFMVDAQATKWKCYFTQQAYDKVKHDPEGYTYEKDGQEWVKVWENAAIPFIIHMLIAGIDNHMLDKDSDSLGCRREIDDR